VFKRVNKCNLAGHVARTPEIRSNERRTIVPPSHFGHPSDVKMIWTGNWQDRTDGNLVAFNTVTFRDHCATM